MAKDHSDDMMIAFQDGMIKIRYQCCTLPL